MDADRKGVDMTAYLIVQSLHVIQTGGVFLRSDDTTGLWELRECLVNELDVLLLELMMVCEAQWGEVLGIRFQVMYHLFRRGDTSE